MAATTKAERIKQKAEQDAIVARVSVALARSQRLIDSWLPASSTSTTENHDDDTANLRTDANAGWGGLPDRVGLGGKVEDLNGTTTTNGSFNNSELDKLRKQLIGKKSGRMTTGLAAPRPGLTASTPMNGANGAGTNARGLGRDVKTGKAESESDDEGGRSAAFKSRKQKSNGAPPKVHPAVAAMEAGTGKGKAEPDVDSSADEPPPKAPGNKRKMSYLDELLAERSEKMKKKKKKNKALPATVEA